MLLYNFVKFKALQHFSLKERFINKIYTVLLIL